METPRSNSEATSSPSRPDRPSIRHCERSSPVKNRMLEIGTSGSVRGGDGNIPTYSAPPSLSWQHARWLPGRRTKAASEGNRGRWAPLSGGAMGISPGADGAAQVLERGVSGNGWGERAQRGGVEV